jgi:hypothetical protein
MSSNTCTFIIVPDSTSQCKRYSISKPLLSVIGILGVILLIVLGGALYILLGKYGTMSMKVEQLEKLRKVSVSQKDTIDRYEQDVTQLSSQLSQIKQLNSRLMMLTGLDPSKGVNNLGLGGSEEAETKSDNKKP